MGNRKSPRLTPDQRNTAYRRQALEQYTRALRSEIALSRIEPSQVWAARCFFARAVLLEALGV